jgi:hypothetical protein
MKAEWRTMAQPPLSIAGIAKAYCDDQANVAMYREALVLAQCDVLILQLRANGTILLKSVGAQEAEPAAIKPEESPYGVGGLALKNAEFNQPAEGDAAPTGSRASRGAASHSWDPLQSVFHHIKALFRMEDDLYRRRRRALRNFLAIRNAILTEDGEAKCGKRNRHRTQRPGRPGQKDACHHLSSA